MPSPTFTGNYAKDGKARREQTRAEAGHRCIRCGHPYECGQKRADKGEWSDCDEQCTHKGPIRILASKNWLKVVSNMPAGILSQTENVQAQWRILTVHHFTGEKDNDAWWNQLALCQVCHLSIQTRVNPEIPWMFEHSEWIRPFVGGFYAMKYEGKLLTREEVMARLPELLAYECRLP